MWSLIAPERFDISIGLLYVSVTNSDCYSNLIPIRFLTKNSEVKEFVTTVINILKKIITTFHSIHKHPTHISVKTTSRYKSLTLHDIIYRYEKLTLVRRETWLKNWYWTSSVLFREYTVTRINKCLDFLNVRDLRKKRENENLNISSCLSLFLATKNKFRN